MSKELNNNNTQLDNSTNGNKSKEGFDAKFNYFEVNILRTYRTYKNVAVRAESEEKAKELVEEYLLGSLLAHNELENPNDELRDLSCADEEQHEFVEHSNEDEFNDFYGDAICQVKHDLAVKERDALFGLRNELNEIACEYGTKIDIISVPVNGGC